MVIPCLKKGDWREARGVLTQPSKSEEECLLAFLYSSGSFSISEFSHGRILDLYKLEALYSLVLSLLSSWTWMRKA